MIQEIKEEFSSCNLCSYCDTSNKAFSTGKLDAEIMFIGDCPRRMDAKDDTPLSGPEKEMLEEILASLEISKEHIYFTNLVLCGASGKNRTPSWEEIQNCSKRLEKEICSIKPNVIVIMGSLPLKNFVGEKSQLKESHGKWFFNFKPPYARFFSIIHPSWVLHASTKGEEKAKRNVLWNDMKKFKNELKIANFKINS